MKPPKMYISLNFVAFILSFLFSCKDDDNDLVGQWKPVTVGWSGGVSWGEPTTLELSKVDSFKGTAVQSVMIDQEGIDSIAALQKVDSLINYHKAARLSLLANSYFTMISHEILVSRARPGLATYDTLKGNWTKRNDSLILNVNNAPRPFSIEYRILKLSKDSLVLMDSVYANKFRPHKTVTFAKD